MNIFQEEGKLSQGKSKVQNGTVRKTVINLNKHGLYKAKPVISPKPVISRVKELIERQSHF